MSADATDTPSTGALRRRPTVHQVSATREQITESRALRAETVAPRKEVRLMRESSDQFRDKVPGL